MSKVRNANIHIVRNITPEKAKKLIDVVYKNFEELTEYPELKHNPRELMRLLTSETAKVLLIIINGKIAAYLVGEAIDLVDGRKVFYVSYIYTATKFRKQGFASRLMEYVENLAKEFNYDGVLLTCDTENDTVHNFYLSRGYFPDLILRNYKKHDVLYRHSR